MGHCPSSTVPLTVVSARPRLVIQYKESLVKLYDAAEDLESIAFDLTMQAEKFHEIRQSLTDTEPEDLRGYYDEIDARSVAAAQDDGGEFHGPSMAWSRRAGNP